MKIIILYASAGGGHLKAAEAIYNYFKGQDKDLELKLVDALQKANPLFKNTYLAWYYFTVNHAIFLWTLSYKLTDAPMLRTVVRWIRFMVNRLNLGCLASFLINEAPDVIISAHFLPAEVSAYLKRKGKINSRLITVITDFGLHYFWIAQGTDIYGVASDFTRRQLLREGVGDNKIKVSGIPIDAKFLKLENKEILRDRLNIDRSKFTVLIIMGSFGMGPVEKIAGLLYKEAQILVVCASNKKLYRRLQRKFSGNIKVFGFVDNVEELMGASDIIITKPGGLTISEALSKELMPIFIWPIPGQETANARILEGYGIGRSVKNILDLKETVLYYKENPQDLEKAKISIRKIKKPNAAEELYYAIR